MEQDQQLIRKLVAFAAVILFFAGLPHVFLERHTSASASGSRKVPISPETLFPPVIGDFHVTDRERIQLREGIIEYVASYSDVSRARTAQFTLFDNVSRHNGSNCYLARGMRMREQYLEKIQTADSIVAFQISFFEDESLNASTGSSVLIASTLCSSAGCTESPLGVRDGLRLAFIRPNLAITRGDQESIPLSVLFQSNYGAADQETLAQFRKLMSNFRVGVLEEALLRSP